MKSIVRYARRLFDLPDATIGGEIVRPGGALRMTIRTRDRSGTQVVEVVRDDGNVDALLRDAGRAIVARHRPVHPCDVLQHERGTTPVHETFPETLGGDRLCAHPSAREPTTLGRSTLRGNVRMAQGRNLTRRSRTIGRPIARGVAILRQPGAGTAGLGQKRGSPTYTREMLPRSDVILASRASTSDGAAKAVTSGRAGSRPPDGEPLRRPPRSCGAVRRCSWAR